MGIAIGLLWNTFGKTVFNDYEYLAIKYPQTMLALRWAPEAQCTRHPPPSSRASSMKDNTLVESSSKNYGVVSSISSGLPSLIWELRYSIPSSRKGYQESPSPQTQIIWVMPFYLSRLRASYRIPGFSLSSNGIRMPAAVWSPNQTPASIMCICENSPIATASSAEAYSD